MLNNTIPVLDQSNTDACRSSSKGSTNGSSCAMKYEAFKVACSSCNLRELCLPVGLSQPQLSHLDSLVATRKTVKRGDALFHTGDADRKSVV